MHGPAPGPFNPDMPPLPPLHPLQDPRSLLFIQPLPHITLPHITQEIHPLPPLAVPFLPPAITDQARSLNVLLDPGHPPFSIVPIVPDKATKTQAIPSPITVKQHGHVPVGQRGGAENPQVPGNADAVLLAVCPVAL